APPPGGGGARRGGRGAPCAWGRLGRPPPPRRRIAERTAARSRGARRRVLMRSVPLAARLARRNLYRRPAQAALVLLTLTLATGVFGVGTALHGSADAPWDRVWHATNGFHVSASYYRQGNLAGAELNLAKVRRTLAALGAA